MGPFWGMGLGVGSPGNKRVQQPPSGGSWEDYLRTKHMPGGMSPQANIDEGFGTVGRFNDAFSQFPQQGSSDGLIPKFISMLQGRAAVDKGAPGAAAAIAAAPGTGAVPSQSEMDASTARWAGSPESNPLLRAVGGNNVGHRLPWAGGPFSGMLDNAYEAGGKPDAGLIPKFVNMMGNM